MIYLKRFFKVLLFILILILGFLIYNKYIEQKYINETKNMTIEDVKVVNNVISLGQEKVGLEYVWGGKGEIMTSERLDELINLYGESHYPLNRDKYIGFQAFDCSGLTYWSYYTTTGFKIGYSTVEQKEVLINYKVDSDQLQPGDLIFTPGHVVMYIGKGKVIQSSTQAAYPIGGVKVSSILPYRNGEIYRPIDYINYIKSK